MLVQVVFHLQQSLGFLLGDAHYRDTGPHRDNLRDVILTDYRAGNVFLLMETCLEALNLLADLRLAVTQGGSLLVLLGLD